MNLISNYSSGFLKRDLFAGITVAALLIPQGMAYALIAGLPPIYGLYAALTPQIIYALLGTSRQLAVGPVAMDSLLVATGLGALSIDDPSQYILMAIFLAFLVGAIQLLMGLFRMGFIISFLSKPVIIGFTSAAAVIIGLSQLKYIMGIELSQSNQLHIFIQSLINSNSSLHFMTIIISITSVVFILLIKKLNRKIPSALIAVILGILWVYFNGLDKQGVSVVGVIPEGLPSFQTPSFEVGSLKKLFPTAFTLALVAFMEAISIGKTMEEKYKNYVIDPNQELIALGSANIIGSFFQSYPTTGGFSRTAVNDQAGAKTGVAALVTALSVAIILMFFTHWFYFLPKAVLASIIITAVINLVDFKFAIRLYKKRKDEFVILIITFLATLFLGITEGILLGILISLLLLVYRASMPHYAFLGRIGNTNYFKNVNRFPEEIIQREDLIILRFDAQLFFGNIQFFKELVLNSIKEKEKVVKGFVINARAINYIDSTASEQLYDLILSLQKKGIRVMVVGAIGPARDIILKSKIIKILKKQNLFITSGDATDDFDGITKKTPLQKKLSRQSNT